MKRAVYVYINYNNSWAVKPIRVCAKSTYNIKSFMSFQSIMTKYKRTLYRIQSSDPFVAGSADKEAS